jgi:flagellar biosynthesis protein
VKKKIKESEQPKMAAAIRYDAAKDDAPRLTAKGKGHMAERIIELARQHDIPVRSDRALVQILSKLDMDQHIPSELYRAVAEILAFVYSSNEKYREKQGIGDRG